MSGWFDGIKIDEVAFCEAFTEECPLIFVTGLFFGILGKQVCVKLFYFKDLFNANAKIMLNHELSKSFTVNKDYVVLFGVFSGGSRKFCSSDK